MSYEARSAELIAAIADLREEAALSVVKQRLEVGDDPLRLVDDCQAGLREVGQRYEQNTYFLAGLIMGGEIFRQVMELVQPVVKHQASGDASGTIMLGTVQGDIHDLGKNIVSMLLSCDEFAVYDLGVDVAPETFVAKAMELRPDIVGLSGLLTSSYESMRETITLLRASGCQAPIIIGGGQLSEEVRRYVGADYWTSDASVGVELCQRLIAERLPT